MERGAQRVVLIACMVVWLVLTGRTTMTVLAARTHSGQKPACIFDHMMLRSPTTICRPRAKDYPPAIKGAVEPPIGSLPGGS
jgi:hypothetical protein